VLLFTNGLPLLSAHLNRVLLPILPFIAENV
jgi:hypothetical protein